MYATGVYGKPCLRESNHQVGGNTLDSKPRKNRHEPYGTVTPWHGSAADVTAVYLRCQVKRTVK